MGIVSDWRQVNDIGVMIEYVLVGIGVKLQPQSGGDRAFSLS